MASPSVLWRNNNNNRGTVCFAAFVCTFFRFIDVKCFLLLLLFAVLDGDAVPVDLGLLPRHPHARVGVEVLEVVRDGHHLDLVGRLGEGLDRPPELRRSRSRVIALLQNNDAGLVLFQSLDVLCHPLHALVAAAPVDGDPDSLGVGRVELGRLELGEAEAATQAGLGAVLLRLAVHDRAGADAARFAARFTRRAFFRVAWLSDTFTFSGPRLLWQYFFLQWMFGIILLCFTILTSFLLN
jgi:hypothetical protein